jgi:tetratricopeptide (TPR) repeat protein
MLEKGKAKTWVKVVTWTMVVSVAVGFSLLALLPGRQTVTTGPANDGRTPSERNLSPVTSPSSEGGTGLLIDQGDQALDQGDLDQAILFFKQAYAADSDNHTAHQKLADAYYSQGLELKSTDAAGAESAFKNYLELLPDGSHAEHAQSALDELNEQ